MGAAIYLNSVKNIENKTILRNSYVNKVESVSLITKDKLLTLKRKCLSKKDSVYQKSKEIELMKKLINEDDNSNSNSELKDNINEINEMAINKNLKNSNSINIKKINLKRNLIKFPKKVYIKIFLLNYYKNSMQMPFKLKHSSSEEDTQKEEKKIFTPAIGGNKIKIPVSMLLFLILIIIFNSFRQIQITRKEHKHFCKRQEIVIFK